MENNLFILFTDKENINIIFPYVNNHISMAYIGTHLHVPSTHYFVSIPSNSHYSRLLHVFIIWYTIHMPLIHSPLFAVSCRIYALNVNFNNMKIEKKITDFISQRCENSCLFLLLHIAPCFVGIARHVPHFFPLTKQNQQRGKIFNNRLRQKEIEVWYESEIFK